jgi:hypothetical protein
MDTKERLKQLQDTIDRLDKVYGKGTVLIAEGTPEQIEKENKRLAILKLKRFWVNFVYYKQSTELWDKVDFEQIFENSQHLLKVSIGRHETGPYYIGDTENEKTINTNKKFIEKLREIYNKRFGEIETKFDTQNDLKICFLVELGVIDHLISKNLTPNKIAEIIEFLTKKPISKGSVNTTLSRITNENLIDKYKTQLSALKIKYKI